jgi:type IV secretion system protein VirB10
MLRFSAVAVDRQRCLLDRAPATQDGSIQINNTAGAANTAAGIAVEQSINIPPTLNKNQGELVNIFVARDVDFSSVYQLKRIETRTQILDRTIPGTNVGPAVVTK